MPQPDAISTWTPTDITPTGQAPVGAIKDGDWVVAASLGHSSGDDVFFRHHNSDSGAMLMTVLFVVGIVIALMAVFFTRVQPEQDFAYDGPQFEPESCRYCQGTLTTDGDSCPHCGAAK